jgi:hypothetical protein
MKPNHILKRISTYAQELSAVGRSLILNLDPTAVRLLEDRALSRVPVELWHDIFDFVTSVTSKYEFALDGVV